MSFFLAIMSSTTQNKELLCFFLFLLLFSLSSQLMCISPCMLLLTKLHPHPRIVVGRKNSVQERGSSKEARLSTHSRHHLSNVVKNMRSQNTRKIL